MTAWQSLDANYAEVLLPIPLLRSRKNGLNTRRMCTMTITLVLCWLAQRTESGTAQFQIRCCYETAPAVAMKLPLLQTLKSFINFGNAGAVLRR